GVMLRATSAPGSPYYGVFVTPGNGVVVQYRTAQGVTSSNVPTGGAVPVYLGVGRNGTTFTAYTSPDGVTWTAVPSSSVVLANLGGTLLAGLAVTSHNTSQLSAVTFDTVSSSPNLPAAATRGGRTAPAALPQAPPRSLPSPSPLISPKP
ncbi:MAG: hypothetical protein M3Z97_01720, partial [Candidatus Dormibacteraeota bacterium]|nr:hypothetical protein [Candidatus Dormibacteraeota bacterium]